MLRIQEEIQEIPTPVSLNAILCSFTSSRQYSDNKLFHFGYGPNGTARMTFNYSGSEDAAISADIIYSCIVEVTSETIDTFTITLSIRDGDGKQEKKGSLTFDLDSCGEYYDEMLKDLKGFAQDNLSWSEDLVELVFAKRLATLLI
jgi:hypothetical protein